MTKGSWDLQSDAWLCLGDGERANVLNNFYLKKCTSYILRIIFTKYILVAFFKSKIYQRTFMIRCLAMFGRWIAME